MKQSPKIVQIAAPVVAIFLGALLFIGTLYLMTVYLTAIDENTSRADYCEYVNGKVYSKETKRTGNRYATDPWSAGTSGKCILSGGTYAAVRDYKPKESDHE